MKIQINCTKQEYESILRAKDQDAIILEHDWVINTLYQIIKRGYLKVVK